MEKAPFRGAFLTFVPEMGAKLCYFLNFSGANAGSADLQALRAALYSRSYTLKIYIPAALGHVMGVTDTIAKLRPAPTKFTILRHKTGISFDLRTLSLPACQPAAQLFRGGPALSVRCRETDQGDIQFGSTMTIKAIH